MFVFLSQWTDSLFLSPGSNVFACENRLHLSGTQSPRLALENAFKGKLRDYSRGAFPVLSRDPSLFRKPSENPGETDPIEKSDGCKECLESRSSHAKKCRPPLLKVLSSKWVKRQSCGRARLRPLSQQFPLFRSTAFGPKVQTFSPTAEDSG